MVYWQARDSQAVEASSWDGQGRSSFSLGPTVTGWVGGWRGRGGSLDVAAQRRVSCSPIGGTGSARNGDHARPNGKQPPRPGRRASEIKRKRRERRFDSNTKQIIPPGMEQNKSEWSLTAVIPIRKATAGGPGTCRPREASQGPSTWSARPLHYSGERRSLTLGGPNPLSHLNTLLLGWFRLKRNHPQASGPQTWARESQNLLEALLKCALLSPTP